MNAIHDETLHHYTILSMMLGKIQIIYHLTKFLRNKISACECVFVSEDNGNQKKKNEKKTTYAHVSEMRIGGKILFPGSVRGDF